MMTKMMFLLMTMMKNVRKQKKEKKKEERKKLKISFEQCRQQNSVWTGKAIWVHAIIGSKKKKENLKLLLFFLLFFFSCPFTNLTILSTTFFLDHFFSFFFFYYANIFYPVLMYSHFFPFSIFIGVGNCVKKFQVWYSQKKKNIKLLLNPTKSRKIFKNYSAKTFVKRLLMSD